MLFNSLSISCVGRFSINLIASPPSLPFSVDFNANAHSNNSNNFSIAHRRFQINNTFEFIFKFSNTLTQNDEIIFMKNDYDDIFLK